MTNHPMRSYPSQHPDAARTSAAVEAFYTEPVRWVAPVKAEANYRAHALAPNGRTHCGRFGTPINGWEPASTSRLRCRRCAQAVDPVAADELNEATT